MITAFFELKDKDNLEYLKEVYNVKVGQAQTTQWGNNECYKVKCRDFFDLDFLITECFKDKQEVVMFSIDARVFFAYNNTLGHLISPRGQFRYQGLLFCTSDLDFVKSVSDDYSFFDGLYYYIHKELK